MNSMANRISSDRVPSVNPDHGDHVPGGQVPIETADRFAAFLATIRSTASSVMGPETYEFLERNLTADNQTVRDIIDNATRTRPSTRGSPSPGPQGLTNEILIEEIIPQIFEKVITPALDTSKREAQEAFRKIEQTAGDIYLDNKLNVTDAEQKRRRAKLTLNEHIEFLTTVLARMESIEKRLTTLDQQSDLIYNKGQDNVTSSDLPDLSNDDMAQLDSINKLRDNLHKERRHLESQLYCHFNDTLGGIKNSSKYNKERLDLPRNPSKGASRQIINAVKSYLNQHVSEFYVILPYITYTMNSLDPKTGLFSPTPSPQRADQADSVPRVLKARFIKQNATLYSEILRVIPQSEMAKILAPFKCGINRSHEARGYKDDGASCIYALLSKYGRTDAHTITELESKFKASPRLFELGSPARAVKQLRDNLNDVLEREIPLKASEVITPVVDILGERFAKFAVRLEPFSALGDDSYDCAPRLEQMYSEIEAVPVQL